MHGGHQRERAPDPELSADETLDAIGQGAVRLIQRRRGYRFSIDAVLLATFVGACEGRVIDLGTGCGIIPLLMAAQGARRIVGLEIQQGLSALAKRNVSLNGREREIEIVEGDLREVPRFFEKGSFDVVVSNPPWHAVKAGVPSPNRERAVARHETSVTIECVAAAARHLLKANGTAWFVYPTGRFTDLVAAFVPQRLFPRRTRHVHDRADRKGLLVLCEFAPFGRYEILPPLFLHDERGRWTPEVAAMLGEAVKEIEESGGA